MSCLSITDTQRRRKEVAKCYKSEISSERNGDYPIPAPDQTFQTNRKLPCALPGEDWVGYCYPGKLNYPNDQA